MKIYFAGAETILDLFERTGARVLVSFAAQKAVLKHNVFGRIDDVFLDSGAYSAFNVGKMIDIDEYIAFLRKHDVQTFASLDVIGDAHASLKNYEYMASKGLAQAIPAFHFNEDFSYLEAYVERCDYIALGGLVPLKNEILKLRAFLDKCFSIIKDRARVHGFGVNNWEFMKRYPFYSLDATSWHNPHRYGQHFEFRNGHMKRIDGRKVNTKRFHDKTVQLENAVLQFQKAEVYITELWKLRGVTFDEQDQGSQYSNRAVNSSRMELQDRRNSGSDR